MTYINSAPAIGKITHRPGRHCASSAIRDLIEFHGTNLTEAACFGIGAGLGITYLELPEAPVPFMTHVRSLGYEKRAFENMGVPFVWPRIAHRTRRHWHLTNYWTRGGRHCC